MAKETTTTYTITVTHKGPTKTFEQLFRKKATVKDYQTTKGSSATKTIPGKSRYTDEAKIVRAFFKKAAEEAGLDYGGHGKAPYRGPGTYNIEYAWQAYKHPAMRIIFNDVRWDISMPNGAGFPGTIYIWDKNKSFTNETIKFSMTDPELEDKLIKLFDEWGNKYGRRSK